MLYTFPFLLIKFLSLGIKMVSQFSKKHLFMYKLLIKQNLLFRFLVQLSIIYSKIKLLYFPITKQKCYLSLQSIHEMVLKNCHKDFLFKSRIFLLKSCIIKVFGLNSRCAYACIFFDNSKLIL